MSTNHVGGGGGNAVKRPDKVLAPVLWFSMGEVWHLKGVFGNLGQRRYFGLSASLHLPKESFLCMYKGKLKNTRYK